MASCPLNYNTANNELTLHEILTVTKNTLRQAKSAMDRERQHYRDGTHPDLQQTLRAIRERRVRQDCCVICLEGGDSGPNIDFFSACCGQPYHASCYFQQLVYQNNSCGVCRESLPKLNPEICQVVTATSVKHRPPTPLRSRNQSPAPCTRLNQRSPAPPPSTTEFDWDSGLDCSSTENSILQVITIDV